MMDPRLRQLRSRFAAAGSTAFAAYHRAYHKSRKRFFGLKTPVFRAIFRELFPRTPALGRDEAMRLAHVLWRSDWAEEQSAAIALMARVVDELGPDDLPRLHRMTRECEGWGWLDGIALCLLGPIALAHGEPVYREVRRWSDDAWMWTRRAAILVHVVPARRNALAHRFAWPTFEERLPEKEFFVRKAVGWALRECAKHEPRRVFEFLKRVGDRASGLTRREGARRLPAAMRRELGS